MDNLPYELIKMIFEKLEIKDLLNMRLMNKKFKDIVSGFKYLDDNGIEHNINGIKINQLILGGYGYEEDRPQWYHPNLKFLLKDINEIEFYNSNHDDILQSILKSSILNFKSLKRLQINYNSIQDMLIVNRFTNLIHLEILKLRNGFKLELENLKIFKIINGIDGLEINCPKLCYLHCDDYLDEIQINHPESILYLETINYFEKLNEFKNLQYLIIFGHSSFDRSTLKKLSKLRALFLNRTDKSTRSLIGDLLEEKKKLKIDLPRIYLDFLLVRDEEHLNELNEHYDYDDYSYSRDGFDFDDYGSD